VKDCSSGADEEGCDYLHNCPAGDFMCRNGECVSDSFKCNGESDCSDGSDETGCREWKLIGARKAFGLESLPETTTPKPKECDSAFEYTCRSSKECIPNQKLCDGEMDCPFGDDEEDCLDPHCYLKDYVRCKGSNRCIHEKHFCDGIDHCSDGYDEKSCEKSLTSDEYLNGKLCDSKIEFTCSSGDCISKEDICNGVKDCDDGSDEGGKCGACVDNGCEYKCIENPRGAECICPEGSSLSSDYRTCDSEDLCAFDTHLCNQYCRQSYGSVLCYCSEGYELISEHECVAKKDFHNGSLYFVYSSDSVRRTQLFNDSAFYEEHIGSIPDSRILSLSFRPTTNQLYMVIDHQHETDLVVNDGSVSSSILVGSHMKHVAIDWITGNIYYAVETINPGIGVCSPQGEYCRILIKGEYHEDHTFTQHYGGLIFHPKRTQIIWLDYNSEHPNGAVYVADTDGRNARRLDHLDIGRLNSIAIDYIQDKLYVAGDDSFSLIDLHSLKSGNARVDISPRSMIIFNGYFYYIQSSFLKRVKLDGTGDETLHHLEQRDVALAIDNRLYYDTFYNPCDEKECSHICVLEHKLFTDTPQAKCICPDQYDMVEGNCVYNGKAFGRVHMSASRMTEMCQAGLICKNGGYCGAIKNATYENPTCVCPDRYDGLYCEISLYGDDEDKSVASIIVLWILLAIVAVLVLLMCIVLARYPSLRHRAELILGRSVPIISSPLSKSNNTSRSPIILASETSSSSISKNEPVESTPNNFPNPMYNAPSTAPFLSRPTYSESPGY